MDITFSCDKCGQHIAIDETGAGNPLVALCFAIEKEFESDFAVYAAHPLAFSYRKPKQEPFEIDTICRFDPRHVHLRFVAQSSVFSVHPKPWEAMEDKNVVKLVGSKSLKIEFREMLEKYGITRATLFPDLDGLAATLCEVYGYIDLPEAVLAIIQERARAGK